MADDLSTWVTGVATVVLALVTVVYVEIARRLLREQRKFRRLQAEGMFYPDVHIHTQERGVEHDGLWVHLESAGHGYLGNLSLKATAGNLSQVIKGGDPHRIGFHSEDRPERHIFEYDLTSFARSAADAATPTTLLVEVSFRSVTGGSYRYVEEFRGLRRGPKGGFIFEMTEKVVSDNPLTALAATK